MYNDDNNSIPNSSTNDNIDIHAIAAKYVEAGKTVIPVQGKKTLFNWKEFQDRDTTKADLNRWSRDSRITGFALIPKRGDVVIDFDNQELYRQFGVLCKDEILECQLPIQKSGKGYHIALNCPDVFILGKENLNKVDIITSNSYVLIEGSLHPSGVRYQALRGSFSAIPEIDDITAEYLLGVARELGRKEPETTTDIERNHEVVTTGNRSASKLIARYNQETDVEELLVKHGYTQQGTKWLNPESTTGNAGGVVLNNKFFTHNGSSPLANGHSNDAFEVLSVLEFNSDKKAAYKHLCSLYPELAEIERKTQSLPDLDKKLADIDHAREFQKLHGEKFRYSNSHGWLIWDGKRWQRDELDAAKRAVFDVGESYIQSVPELTRHEDRQDMLNYARYCGSHRGSSNVLEVAKTLEGIRVSSESFDSDLDLINLSNGTYSLGKNSLQPHKQADMLTKLANITYDEKAECPKWIAFQREICAGDDELIRYKQVMYGAALSGRVLRGFFVMYGTGANGKSTELGVIQELLGDYANSTSFDTFMGEKNNFVLTELARLQGIRFVSASESSEDADLHSELVKTITGGDPISAKFSHQNSFTYAPQFKIYLATNYKPRIKGTDHGIWERINLVPYSVTIPKERQDPNLKEKLLSESSGILNWLLEGYRLYKELGYKLPECHAVDKATNEYKTDEDIVQLFVHHMCDVGVNYRDTTANLYKVFKYWCDDEGVKALTKKKFGMRLSDLGYNDAKGTGGTRYREGIKTCLADDIASELPVNQIDYSDVPREYRVE
jgi:putative DNA primase/helicase